MRVVYGGSQTGTRKSDGQILQGPRDIAEVESNQQQSTDKNVRPVRRINGERIRFRDLALFAFPKKAEANLAFLARVDIRTARRWLSDDGNEPPADVLGVVLAEIMRRYGQRD